MVSPEIGARASHRWKWKRDFAVNFERIKSLCRFNHSATTSRANTQFRDPVGTVGFIFVDRSNESSTCERKGDGVRASERTKAVIYVCTFQDN